MTTRIEKSFDCIAFKRKVQSEIYEQIKDMTPQEKIEYFRKAAHNGPLGEWWKRVSEQGNREVTREIDPER